jgi:hypothetical protein
LFKKLGLRFQFLPLSDSEKCAFLAHVQTVGRHCTGKYSVPCSKASYLKWVPRFESLPIRHSRNPLYENNLSHR